MVGAQTKTLKAAPGDLRSELGHISEAARRQQLAVVTKPTLSRWARGKATSRPPRRRSGDFYWLKATQPVSGGANAQTGRRMWDAVLGPSHTTCQPTGPLPLPPASLTPSSTKLQTRPPGLSTTEEPPWEPRTLAQPHKGFRGIRQLWEERRLRAISRRRGLLPQ